MWQLSLLMLSLLMSLSAQAVTLSGDLIGGQFRWKNALPANNNTTVPSSWSVIDGLAPTSEWVPGGAYGSAVTHITLSGAGETVSVPFQVIGFEYNTGSANPTEGSAQAGLHCSDYRLSGGVVRVAGGAGCIYPKSLTQSGAYNPYSFIRPMINFDSQNLKTALSGKPQGIYRGSVSVINFYDYYVYSGVRTRHYDTHTVIMEIDYQPSYLTSVDITGTGMITPRYDLYNDIVEGEALFQGIANGWFTNGLTVSLKPTRSLYELSGPGSSIAYDIDCIGCNTSSLVADGSVSKYSATLAGSNVSQIHFQIKVGFEQVKLADIVPGSYNDTFVLMFEAGI